MDVAERRTRSLAVFVAGVAEGRIGVGAFIPLDAEQIVAGWRRCIAALQVGHVTQDTVTTLQMLRLADPAFEKAHFLLGLAFQELGQATSARHHFEAQLARGVPSLEGAVRDALATLPRDA